jgi:hypothetical protein
MRPASRRAAAGGIDRSDDRAVDQPGDHARRFILLVGRSADDGSCHPASAWVHGSPRPAHRREEDVVVILFASQSTWLILLFLLQAWAVAILLGNRSRRANTFGRRLDQLIALLLPPTETPGRRAGLRWSARRWRPQLGAVYAQGYLIVSEAISRPAQVAHTSRLVQEAVVALRTGRAGGGPHRRVTEDPVVVLAYGLGAWPSDADLTTLEQLLDELDISQGTLRSRFESLVRKSATANANREFRELAGASFVLGASTRIVEAASPPGRNAPPPRWLAALRAHRQ